MTCGGNMFKQMARMMTAMGLVAALTACGGAQMETEAPGLVAAAQPAAASHVRISSAPLAGVAGVAGVARVESAAFAAVQHARPLVSESERRAEELRMVDFEQSYSLEMNRLGREQTERAQRTAVALRAGVQQGPGCEGTEGHAALECERSLM